MPNLIDTIDIKASPEAVWAVLGDLAATTDWLPGTVNARVDSGTRICVMADGSEVHEQIDNYSTTARSYDWQHLRVALPVRDSHGRFSVLTNDSGGATVVLEMQFVPIDESVVGEVTTMIHGAFHQSLESLRQFVEHGIRWNAALSPDGPQSG
ncbi:uncharacterized protein YndB with AHSA1/START domain [Kribbella orskensis]|uniref:Uncharacterized protein YndB with AHSA1/START domain n=1 Tax=Kribbella orskensis TaxID=2512216 RepID=A0ABY2BMM2_9ACTN|nr:MULTISPECIES: SRPBCC family protein [Kribbella]TCN41754.1 uncharacterized protein YndB with AHSA1/START domain [Kribbella sp. VKM Ac-2500]TCO25632.1 uncharacterized protein YndB with AHSA1/START domain [Kribbella orskensis]